MPNLNNTTYSGSLWAGSVWYTGTTSPDPALGVNGDWYFDSALSNIYHKEALDWQLKVNIKGPQGIKGDTGSQGNQGIQGIQGNAGTNGTNGVDGATIRTGLLAPVDGTGKNGDLYVNTVSGLLYQRVNGVYVQQGSLAGPAGPQGVKGDTGAGFPTGGLTGQFLRKNSNNAFDTNWTSLSNSDITTALGFIPIGTSTNSVFTVTNTSPSTNLATGAVVVSGGMGVAGAIYAGGNISTGGNLTVAGDLVVSGTALKVESRQLSLTDPIINLAGTTTLTTNDGLDRGIVFQWHNGVIGKAGFFGFNRSSQKFVFINDATENNGLVTGSVSAIDLSGSLADIRSAFTAGNNVYISNGVISASLTESSTLAQVTQRGATTSDKISITNITNTTGLGTGALSVAGGVSISGSLVVGGSLVASSLSYAGGSQIDNTPIGQTIAAAGGFSTLRSTDTTDTSNTATGSFTTLGGVGIAKGLYVGLTSTFLGQVRAQSNTASSSTGTGALVVTGGLGVGGSIYATSIENTAIGATTPNTGVFSTLQASGQLRATNSATASTASTGALVVSGGIGVGLASVFGSTVLVQGVLSTSTNVNIAGNAYVTGDVYSAYTSDETLKDLLHPVTDVTEKLRTLESWFYKFKEGLDKDQSQPVKIGLLAGQVAKVFPEIVKIRDDKTKAVFYEQMIPVLIAGFNELDKRLTALENK